MKRIVFYIILCIFICSNLFAVKWYKYNHKLTNENLNFIEQNGLFVVGNKGTVLFCKYSNLITYYPIFYWLKISTNTNENLYGICKENYNKSYGVGLNGTIIYNIELLGNFYNSESPTNKNLYSVYLNYKPDTGYIVGEGGIILYGGGTDSKWYIYKNSPTTNNLYSISSSFSYDYPNSACAVGANGTILDYENGVWSLYTNSPTNEDLYSVCVYYGKGFDYAWACGANGTILVKEGNNWIKVDSGITEDLYCIWGCYHPNPDVHCVGANGTILYSYGGYKWVKEECPVNVDLHGVAGNSGYVWAVGDGGTILLRGMDPNNIKQESFGMIKALFNSQTIQSNINNIY